MNILQQLFGKSSSSPTPTGQSGWLQISPPITSASPASLKATLIVRAGTNASARSETAGRLKPDPRTTVIEIADAAALKLALMPYAPHTPICAQLFYSFPPGTTGWMRPDVWWREVRANFEQWLPEIAEGVQAQANINLSTGGGFLQLDWEQVTPRELEMVCHYFDENLA